MQFNYRNHTLKLVGNGKCADDNSHCRDSLAFENIRKDAPAESHHRQTWTLKVEGKFGFDTTIEAAADHIVKCSQNTFDAHVNKIIES